MPASFQKIIGSRLFKFIVGEAADGIPTEFYVHEEAIAQLSESLRILLKSSPEARAGEAIWKEVSKETFELFAQYAYTGDYSIPKTEKRIAVVPPKLNGIHHSDNKDSGQNNVENAAQPSSPDAPNGLNGIRGRVNSLGSDETPTSEIRDGSMYEKLDDDGTILNYPSLLSKKNKKKKKAALEKVEREKEAALKIEEEPEVQVIELQPETQQKVYWEEPPVADGQPAAAEPELISLAEPEQSSEEHILTTDFHSLSYSLHTSRNNYEGTCEPSMDFEKDHSYSNVLLSHASLYVLGDSQLIDNLKALALFKLHKTLCTFILDSENIGDITDLARYAYAKKDKSAEEGNGGLRGLVCQYMAIHAKQLSTDAKFMNLLVGGGQIVQDFIKLQLQRTN